MTELKVTAEPGVPQILTEREFDAPRELILRAFTEADLLAQWLGPRGYTMTIERFEPRAGGSWRYVHSDGDGNSYGFHGVFHNDPSPDGFVMRYSDPAPRVLVREPVRRKSTPFSSTSSVVGESL